MATVAVEFSQKLGNRRGDKEQIEYTTRHSLPRKEKNDRLKILNITRFVKI